VVEDLHVHVADEVRGARARQPCSTARLLNGIVGSVPVRRMGRGGDLHGGARESSEDTEPGKADKAPGIG
jgi:hypothetical protein